jgi:hypothetical protein
MDQIPPTFNLSFRCPPVVDEKALLRWWRLPTYNSFAQLEDNLHREAERAVEAALAFCDPFVLIIGSKFTFENNMLRLSTGEILLHRPHLDQLDNCHFLAVIAATMGERIESEIIDLSQKNMTMAYFTNGAAGYFTDQAAETGRRKMISEFSLADGGVTRRCSPGIGRWPLEDLKPLSELVSAFGLQISCSEQNMLNPRFSTIGAVGIY